MRQEELDMEDKERPDLWTLKSLCKLFFMLGFEKESKAYADKVLAIDHDTMSHFETRMIISLGLQSF